MSSGQEVTLLTHIPHRCPQEPGLNLKVANVFRSRLLGVHAFGGLRGNEGLLIIPCRAVHTFFLRQALDIVFLDSEERLLRCALAVRPRRVVFERRAAMVVELPAGYCRRHPDYLEQIHSAMQRLPQRERNTLS